MDKTEFKEKLHAALRQAGAGIAAQWVQRVLSDEADIEDMRKAVSLIAEITGASDRQEKNPYANLPVFNITLVNGQPQVISAQPPPAVELAPLVELVPIAVGPAPAEVKPPPKAAEPIPLEQILGSDTAD